MFPKPTRWESKKYRDAAKDQPCTMRLEGYCNGRTDTTVLAHDNGAGMGTKHSDHNAADMCSVCHDVYDGRVKADPHTKAILSREFARARVETIVNRIERAIIK